MEVVLQVAGLVLINVLFWGAVAFGLCFVFGLFIRMITGPVEPIDFDGMQALLVKHTDKKDNEK